MVKDKVITEPRVYLIGRQGVDQKMLKAFLDDEGLIFETDTEVPAEVLAEAAGRTCYMSFGKGRKTNADYLERIISSHHGSVLEHAVWNFLITGVSRSLTHELIRHRAGFGFSQLSQRYVDESEASYVCPPFYRERPKLYEKWLAAVEAAHDSYVDLVEVTEPYVAEEHPELASTDRRKIVRQSARSVLPNACETKIFVSANGRALRHFFEMRGSPHADTEIRELAVAMCRIMKEEAPNIFADVEVVLEDGIETISVKHSKV
ncbi:MAG: FAD-dependent thymidylate synthase [Proteobacteria bacterium]|nr:FAD-dependent thymidylate synthase [Pseudomonadota bacterium]